MKNWYLLIILLLAIALLGAVIAVANLPPAVPAFGTLPPESEDTSRTEPSASSDPTEEITEPTEPEPTWMTFPEDRKLTAKQYFVYDCAEERFTVLSGSANDRIYPASITKLFTAYVALQYLDEDAKITAGDALELIVPGSSVAEIKKGDVLTVRKLIEAMLLPSGNDAAYILAAEVGRILDGKPNEGAWFAIERFMREVNQQAQALGMTGTHFVNPDGIHSGDHYMTPEDLVLMARLSLQEPVVVEYATTAHDTVTLSGGEEKAWKNTNSLVNEESPYYCPFCVGLKTGQTPAAGSCLLSAFQMEDRTLIIGVFGCPDVDDRFEDTLQLFNAALDITN